ncbi:hypothetical protein HOY82DRAFT_543179 [Tuber indicum]|nr:hypothetical protein HOY82DRAFT_543179 [Tuber indicum]
MYRSDIRASTKKRKSKEAHKTPAEPNKRKRLHNGTGRSSPVTVSDFDDDQEDATTVATTSRKITKASSAKNSSVKAKISASKAGSKISQSISKSAENDAEKVAKANISKQAPNPTKPSKRKRTGDESDEGLKSPIPDKRAKVAERLKGKTIGESTEKAGKVAEAHGTSKAMATFRNGDTSVGSNVIISDNTSESSEASESEDEIEIISPKGPKNIKSPKGDTAANAGEVMGSTSGNDLQGVTSGTSSVRGNTGDSSSPGQIPKDKLPRNSFIITDPNKPRPRGLGRLHFKETPAYKKLMEVATQVKRVARIMTDKLVAAKAASMNDPSTDTQKAIDNACEKMEKFIRIYSSQVKFLNDEECMALLKAAVQCLCDAQTGDFPNHNFQKALCTFLKQMELSERQATTLGLYPILELYRVAEESGDIGPDVAELVASIEASLLRKSKEAEGKLVNPDYIPEDYLTKMQKRILSMGNISKPIFDDWDKFLQESARPNSSQRAQRPTFEDQVCASYQPLPPVIRHTPVNSEWVKKHMVSQIISKKRANRRFVTKMNNLQKVTRERNTYQEKPDDENDPIEYTSFRRPLRFDETVEGRAIPEYDAFGKPHWINEV